MTFDKLYKAGDNGEYMYQYCRKHQKDVEIYYIVRKESPDYERLVREDRKHILVYGTMRCQLICLLAEPPGHPRQHHRPVRPHGRLPSLQQGPDAG